MNLNGRQASPALSATLGPGHVFNASEIGPMPRAGTVPRGAFKLFNKFKMFQV